MTWRVMIRCRPAFVTRPETDTDVKVTATLTYKDKTRTKEFTLKVKAAPEEISEDDYTDYFFAYFAGRRLCGRRADLLRFQPGRYELG